MLAIGTEINGIIKYDVQEANSNIVTFLLVHLGFDDSDNNLSGLSYTDAPINISFDSDIGSIPASRIYLSNTTLKSISPPKSEGDIERDLFELSFADPLFSLSTTLSLQSTGVPVEIHLGFKDIDSETLVQDALPIYSGQISAWSTAVNDEEPVLTINCTGPLTKLQQVTNFLTTKNSQQRISADDTCFDYAANTDNEVALYWGPAGGNNG